MKDSYLNSDLEKLLTQSSETPLEGHLEDVDLAAWLDGVAEDSRRERIELHLSQCPSCRLLTTETKRVLSPVETRTTLFPHRMVMAAGLLFVLGLAMTLRLFSGPSAADLQAFSLEAHDLQSLSADYRQTAREAVEGSWPSPPDLPFLLGEEAVFRSSDARSAPRPLSPRWSSRLSAPVALVWQASSSEDATTLYHLMVVDEQENVLQREAVAATGNTWLEFSLTTPLPPGRSFAWKISAETEGEWLASEWVPFRTLPAEEEAWLVDHLQEASSNPFLEAVAYAEVGMIDAAVSRLSRLPNSQTTEKAISELWARKHLDSSLEILDRSRLRDP